MRRLFILRGVQGSGKSTIADDLVICYPHSRVVSTDNFWMTTDGEYVFDPRKLKEAHAWCFRDFQGCIAADVSEIILDNTNTRTAHFQEYIDYAETYGYTVIVITVSHPDPKVGAERNAHSVGEDIIKRGIAGFETWKPET